MIFRPSANRLFWQILVASVLTLSLLGTAIWLALRPQFTRVGYAPEQPTLLLS